MSAEQGRPLVEAYSFGSIRVRGKTYSRDIVIVRDTISDWRRGEGHVASAADIAPILAQKPRVVVIGTGSSGRMHVSEDAVKRCGEEGIELIVKPTAQATDSYNAIVLEGKRTVAGAFHITC